MKRLAFFGAMLLVGVMALSTLAQAQIVIGSFDDTRSRAPFATETGSLGYGHLRAALLDLANFGPGGIVSCTVTIAPGTPTITKEYLADKTVFFTSVFTGNLSAAEGTALADFVGRGGVVIVDANSLAGEQTAANSLLAAIGATATIGPATLCTGSNTGGAVAIVDNAVTNGPFGDVQGDEFATTPSAEVHPGAAVVVATCDGGGNLRAVYLPGVLGGPGLTMLGGDPSAFDLFTIPQITNEILYLNAIASACVCWEDETAWAAGSRYVSKGNWATYTSYSGTPKTVNLFAGQNILAGTVQFSAPSGGNVTITVDLNGEFRFDPDDMENLKVQGYASAPNRKPSPGRFANKKYCTASPCSITVPQANFYGVEVDVQRKVECPE